MKMKSEKIMSEAENLDLELELENESEVESPSTIDLINALQRGDFTSADQLFRDSLDAKVQDTLDAEKVAVADQIFNGEDPYAEIEDEDYVEDDDLEVYSEVEEEEFVEEE